ncbi:MAG TPA: metallophosphoesterase [Tepidisphaeraceae bacterium]|nr:metallophosphoesterase [Tepidisphaeraceae bacterium]
MPITLPPISRRRFLSTSLAAGAAFLSGCSHNLLGQRDADPDCFALLSDIHIPSDKTYAHSAGARPWNNIQQVTREVLEMSPRPSAALISGDCACLHGLPEDYLSVVDALQPFREGGMPVHVALGNHDNRNNFWKALPQQKARKPELADRHLTVIASPRANWFLLDSLETTNKTPGVLGENQLAWLANSLDARPDKPALVMFHHNPDYKPKTDGLVDTEALLKTLLPRKQVKACIFGHTHVWQHRDIDGLHFVNLPTTAWTFTASQPAGWVESHLYAGGASFRLHTLNPEHPQRRQLLEIAWR